MPEWLSTVFNYAPRLATALGTGGKSEIVKLGLSVAGELLTGEPVDNVPQLRTIIENATPEQLLLLKNADQEFQARLTELQAEERANTRQAITQSAKFAELVDYAARRIIGQNLSYIMLLVMAQVITVLVAVEFLGDNAAMITAIIGNTAGMAIQALFKERQDMVGLLSGSLPSNSNGNKAVDNLLNPSGYSVKN